MTNEKVRENRLRRIAQRRGFAIKKSPRRDPNAIDYGGYMLIDAGKNLVILGAGQTAFDANLDEIESYLNAGHKGSLAD